MLHFLHSNILLHFLHSNILLHFLHQVFCRISCIKYSVPFPAFHILLQKLEEHLAVRRQLEVEGSLDRMPGSNTCGGLILISLSNLEFGYMRRCGFTFTFLFGSVAPKQNMRRFIFTFTFYCRSYARK